MKTFYFLRRRKAVGILFLVRSVFQQSLPAQELPLLYFITFWIPLISSKSAQEIIVFNFQPYSRILHVAPHQAGISQFQWEVFWHQKRNFHIFDVIFGVFFAKIAARNVPICTQNSTEIFDCISLWDFFLNHCFFFLKVVSKMILGLLIYSLLWLVVSFQSHVQLNIEFLNS